MPGTIFRKAVLLLAGAILFLVCLEAGLRAGGFVVSCIQEYKNLQWARKQGVYRILCLGESMTYEQYPSYLEKNLNRRHLGVRFKVIDKGMVATSTPAILERLGFFLNAYHPQMVVAMMGINDEGIQYYEAIPESSTWFFKHCRVYRLFRIFYMNFLQGHTSTVFSPTRKPAPEVPSHSFEASSGRNTFLRIRDKGGDDTRPMFPDLPEVADRSISPQRQKDLSRAQGSFEKAVKLDPRDDRAYVKLGKAYLDSGVFSKALKLFIKAIELDPQNDRAYAGWGWCHLAQNQWGRAKPLFERALEIDPQNNYALSGMGRIFRLQGDFAEAERLIKKALARNPSNFPAYVDLEWIYRTQGQFAKAEAMLQSAIRKNPDSGRMYLLLGRLYRVQGGHFPAEEFLKKAIQLDPELAEAYLELGMFYALKGQWEQAEDPFKKAIVLDPSNAQAYFELGGLYQLQARYAEAEIFFKKSMENHPVNRERVLNALILLYQELGKPELASKYVQKVSLSKFNDLSATTVHNYRELKRILDLKGIKLVCVQYPMRDVEPLKQIFTGNGGIFLVDNERSFKEAVRREGYKEYFRDIFAGDFGHCTRKGNELLAANIADIIIKKIFSK